MMSIKRVGVVIVEDDQDLRESITRFLTIAGHRTVGVGSGMELYQAIAGSSFDVALIDIGLPDQSGYVLADYLRRNTDLGIIILTARDDIEDRVAGYAAGADLYLVKPVNMQELAAAIVSLAQRRRGEERGAAVPPEPSWFLERSTWSLITPAGEVIVLTGRERELMFCLAETGGTPVERRRLYAVLGYTEDNYATRALDALVRRLRKKVRDRSGCDVPILTFHGIGYCFAARIAVQ